MKFETLLIDLHSALRRNSWISQRNRLWQTNAAIQRVLSSDSKAPMKGAIMLPMAFTTMVARGLPTGPLAGLLWLALGLGGAYYGLFGKEYRKGRFGEGEVITSPWRIVRDRIGWCLWGAACLYFSYDAFRH